MTLSSALFKGNYFAEKPWEAEYAGMVGITASMLRFMLAFFASVGVSALLRFVPTPLGRHVYALVTGFLLIYYPFGNGVFHAFVPAMITYVAMLLFRKQCGKLAWLIDFTYLIGCHVSSASGSAWKEGKMDFTGSQMIVTLKLISSAVTYQDGLKKSEDLTSYQQAHKLPRMPNLLEYLSYVFASGNLLAGPTFELADYLDYIERKGPWDPKARKMPSPVTPGLVRFGKALICMGLHLYLVANFSPAVLESDWFYGLSVPKAAAVMWLTGLVARFKYYFAWTVAEAGLILSGFCFNGWDEEGHARWDRYSNARIAQVELSTSFAHLPVHWNTCTGNFLRQYVYERLTPKNKRPPFYVVLITQAVSGVWHGLFPGYAMFFITSAFAIEASKVLYRYERAYSSKKSGRRGLLSVAWAAIKWLITAFILNYSAAAFMLIDFVPGWRAWKSVYFSGHILMFGLVALGTLCPPKTRKPQGKANPAAVDKAIPGTQASDKQA